MSKMNICSWFLLICAVLLSLQPNVDATLGVDCSADSTVCETSGNEMCNGTACVCKEGYYESGGFCASITQLQPTGLTSPSQTHTSVDLSWTSPVASGYTDRHFIRSFKGEVEVLDDQFTTLDNLSPGTTYTIIVARYITKYGQTQTVPSSDPLRATTKLDYGYSCDVPAPECRVDLMCIQDKCLCVDGQYYVNGGCTSIAVLRPSISSTLSTSTSSVTINWNSPPATGYTNSYVIKYIEDGTTVVETSPVSGDVSTHLVTGLQAGTSYTFIVVRSITREGRTQMIMESLGADGKTDKINYREFCVSNGTCKNSNTDCYSSTCGCDPGYFWNESTCLLKINYGEPCESYGTCKNSNTDCYSTTCRCDPGYFWKDTTCFSNTNLSPGNVNTERLSTTQLRVTWMTSAYPEVVTGYLVQLSPSVSTENIVITGTSATISSLTPGERYTITVKSRSNYLNRGETAAAGAVIGIAEPAPTSGLAPATSLMGPVAQIHFYKAEGRADSYTVTLTGYGYSMVDTASGPGDTLSVYFSGVYAGLYYNLTIITISFGVQGDPFSLIIRIAAQGEILFTIAMPYNPTNTFKYFIRKDRSSSKRAYIIQFHLLSE